MATFAKENGNKDLPPDNYFSKGLGRITGKGPKKATFIVFLAPCLKNYPRRVQVAEIIYDAVSPMEKRPPTLIEVHMATFQNKTKPIPKVSFFISAGTQADKEEVTALTEGGLSTRGGQGLENDF